MLTLRLNDPVTERVHDRAGGCLVAAGLSGAAAERLAQHQLRHEPAHNRRVWLRGLSEATDTQPRGSETDGAAYWFMKP